MAVNNFEAPGHIGPVGLDEIITEGDSIGFTTILIPFELTVVGDAQAAVDVIAQLTTSPLASEGFVYKELLPPTFTPFNNH